MKKARMIELLTAMGDAYLAKYERQAADGYEKIAAMSKGEAAAYYTVARMLTDPTFAEALEHVHLK